MKFIIKNCLAISLFLLMSACSFHHQVPAENIKQLTPHIAKIQQGKIEYYQMGSGSPIVLIPGYATDVTSWNRDFLAVLSQQHRIIVMNNRNVGASSTEARNYAMKDMANDTYFLIKKLGLKKVTVIGISMGGMIAQQLALSHPASLDHLILINTAIAGQQAIMPTPDVEKKLRELPKSKLGFYMSAVDLFFPPTWKARMAISLATDRFQPGRYTEIDAGRVMPEQQRVITQWFADNNAAAKLKNIRLPVLILNGKADIVIPPANSMILAENIPKAKLIRWKDGGHAMIYQYPVEMGRVINDWLRDGGRGLS
jgi:pimeloyl-ACP methyl ester carboxylesterase